MTFRYCTIAPKTRPTCWLLSLRWISCGIRVPFSQIVLPRFMRGHLAQPHPSQQVLGWLGVDHISQLPCALDQSVVHQHYDPRLER